MLSKLLIILFLFTIPFISHSALFNGNFEHWNDGSPLDWSSDTGIVASPSITHVSNGALSVELTVNTSNQSNTDFLQRINVEQEKTYQFSVMVYHTKGTLKARLVVDGYEGYSDAQKTDQWQQLSYSYTADSTKTINVGLRFYDQPGFDGSEIVYIDDFLPSQHDNVVQHCDEHKVTLTLTTDSYGEETYWEIKDLQGHIAYSNQGYESSQTFVENMCLSDGSYRFTIKDSQDDGICCEHGDGSYLLETNQTTLASGEQFTNEQTNDFILSSDDLSIDGYYAAAENKTGFALKSALFDIISSHNSRGYSAIWDLIKNADLDLHYENDGTILDMYSEIPLNNEVVSFTKISDQCGQYSAEGDCYNREHSFPKSWFGGKIEPMYSDGHHLFATDGYVNSKRSSWPYGEVANATYISNNGSKLGQSTDTLYYSGTVFEPIDEFKGDFARAYFYIATRYENVIGNWENYSTSADAVLNGTSTSVFEPWLLNMLKRWHQSDPVSQKEIDRNNQVYDFQGNRNPFIDHPEFVEKIWGD